MHRSGHRIASRRHKWVWAAAGAIGIACACLSPPPAFAAEGADTVFLVDGGRVRGSVMVDDDKEVRVQLADGTTRTIDKAQVKRVKYADAAQPQPPPEAQDEPPPPPRRHHVRNMDSPSDYDATPPPPPPAMHMRSPGMVAGGAVMLSLGLAGMIAGAIGVVALVSGNNGEGAAPVAIGAIGGGSTLAITGAVLIGVGRKKVPAEPDAPPPEAWIFRPTMTGFRLDF